MVRKKPKPEDSGGDRKHFVGLTPNQVVAYNLALAREIKGWTQDQAAEALEPYLGVRWSKASVSQAERSVAGGFVRNFTADEIVAFARCYERPVTWFFMPPPPLAGVGVATRLAVADAPRMGENVAMLVDLVFGDRNQQYDLCRRLDAFLAATVPGSLTDAQHRVAALADQRVAALVRHAFTGLGHWQTSLRSLANQLEDLEARSKLAMASQLDVDVDDLGMPHGAVRADTPAEDSPASVGTGGEVTPADSVENKPARKRRTESPTKSARQEATLTSGRAYEHHVLGPCQTNFAGGQDELGQLYREGVDDARLDTFKEMADAGRGAPPPTDNDVSITWDGRRLDSKDKVLAFLAELDAARVNGLTIGPPLS